MSQTQDSPLIGRILECELCRPYLPLGPRPLLKVSPEVRILVIGQAPGRLAHESGTPWNDPSGDRLRAWLGIDRDVFYEHPGLGLLPMGFCYPGKGKSGDLAPRPECAEAWHEPLFAMMPKLECTLLVGKYSQEAYATGVGDLGAQSGGPRLVKTKSVTERVRQWQSSFPALLPLPHPSPRNNLWLRRNPWFEREVLPALQDLVRKLLG